MVQISSLAGLIPGVRTQQNLAKSNDSLQAAVASLVAGEKVSGQTQDVASLAQAALLQANNSALRAGFNNLAQAGSLLQVAGQGVGQIGDIVDRLSALATQANSGTLSDSDRQALNTEAQGLVKQIDQIVGGSRFGGKNLLDGTISGSESLSVDGLLAVQNSSNDALSSLSISSLSSTALLGAGGINLLSQSGAASAQGVLKTAAQQVSQVQADIGAFSQSVDYASAGVESAIFNQEAARSTLSDTDFAAASTDKSQAQVQRNAAIALAAQGNRLTPAILQLIA